MNTAPTITLDLPLALIGGAYGNVPALRACLEDARAAGCRAIAFLGDLVGCCGHSDEVLALAMEAGDFFIAGNLEREAARGSTACGCGYTSAEDERASCQAMDAVLRSYTAARWNALLDSWPEVARVQTTAGALLLCHGSPDRQNEFLYDSTTPDTRLESWLSQHHADLLACTHTGLPWMRSLSGGRTAINIGVAGKPDHDGDPAVHYAIIRADEKGGLNAELRRVAYNHPAWCAQLRREGIGELFITPLETGRWTIGLSSLPERERR